MSTQQDPEQSMEVTPVPVNDGTSVELANNGQGAISSQELVDEMETSYMSYAMSVIVQRALPDVRDGMKPIHRRILYAMSMMGVRHNVKYVKSARITGEVMGKYHPHGNAAIYDAMARMAQTFSLRQILIDGQGNFGSIDGDNPAAERYTEARMSKLGEEMLQDIDKDTVTFVDNYDGSLREPSVLPSRVPGLLLNGTIGIAVGMATNIPSHNLGELCDGVVAQIDNPEITVEELMQHIPGPDFPTGAEIYAGNGIREAYTTGKGKFAIRAIAEVEERKGGFRIVISQIPYQVNKADLVSKIADLVKDKKIEGITDLRDESNRNGMRIVIELKATSYPKKVLNQLYEMTPLQTMYHANMLALVDTIEPRVLGLKEILGEFIKHRQVVVRRRSEFELRKAQERAHILEGLLIALDAIDEVVRIIRASKNRETAREALMSNFKLSELQANAILDMRLSALVGLERDRLQGEYDEKMKFITYLLDLLAHEEKILAVIREETLQVKSDFAVARKTTILPYDLDGFTPEDLIPNEEVLISLTRTNYIKRVTRDTYRSQARGGKGVIGMSTKDEDEVAYLVSAKTHDSIYFFTDQGKLYKASVHEIPASSRQAKGQAIVNLIQIGADEKVTAVLTLPKTYEQGGGYFIMGTVDGTIKKTPIAAYANVRKTGIIAITLNDDNKLRWVKPSMGSDTVLMVSAKAQAILFKEEDVRPTGRSAAGVRGMKLRPEDRVVAMDVLDKEALEKASVITVFENGFGKRTLLTHFDPQARGGMGIKAAAVTPKVGEVVYAVVVLDDSGELFMISSKGTALRIPMKDVKMLGRVTQGVTLMRLSAGDKVANAAVLDASEDDGDVAPPLPSK
jgi:DNA gyrase subunit A